jgi:transcriptional antiterminator RfaH
MVTDKAATKENWYVLHTKPHKEYLVQELFQREGVATFLPEICVASPRRDRRATRPFFPHYLFAQFDPTHSVIARIRWTPGLRRIVSAGDRPVPVPHDIVNRIRRRLDIMGVIHPQDRFNSGDIVSITRGPFKDLDAVFDQRLSPDGRVRVFLELMGRLVATDLDVEDLRPRR